MATIKDARRDKFSHSDTATKKNQGAPRKGGAGGKGAWGTFNDEMAALSVLDKNDPNYDSEEEKNYFTVISPSAKQPEEAVQQEFKASIAALAAFKSAVKMAVEEFLTSFDREEFVRCVQDLNMSVYHQELPKLLITTALSKKDDLRKKVSSLIQFLYEKELVSSKQMEQGFQHLFNSVPDLSLDVPKAEEYLREFTSRALACECLSDAFSKQLYEASSQVKDAELTAAVKGRIGVFLQEYFASNDIAELIMAVEEMKAPHFHHQVVKTAVSMSMDKASSDRELVSYGLAALTGASVSREEVEKGFEILLQRVEDLYNDVPKVLEYLSCFLARAVSDEVLAPAFLTRVNILSSDMGAQVVAQAQVLLKKKQASALLAQVWGPGDGRSVQSLKKSVRDLVKEFLASKDAAEATKCVKDLNALFFHHEVVKRAVVEVLDKSDEQQQQVVKFLQSLRKEGIISEGQLAMGLHRVQSQLKDLALDAPNAPQVFLKISAALK